MPKNEESGEVRVGRIRKSIERIYNVAPYESLKVVVGIDEEIEWSTLAERQKKTKNWTKLLVKDFNETVEDVFKDQDVSEHKVFHKNATPEPSGDDDLADLDENDDDLDGLDS